MTKRKKLFIFSLAVIVLLVFYVVNVKTENQAIDYDVFADIIPTTNFFSQVEDERKVESGASSEPLELGYDLVAENENFILYLDSRTIGIALYDKSAEYLWYSSYPKYREKPYTETVKLAISSGVIIECFESVDSDLPVVMRYSASEECTKVVRTNNNGCEVDLNFTNVGISFTLRIELNLQGLKAKMINSSLKEIPYKVPGFKYAKEYKLKSLTLFPYLGSENYEINAYSFIPDGSGALIRYTDETSTTALIKRIYGIDYGFQQDAIINQHITNQHQISLPIYGISHGYQQAAVFVQIENGAGAAELHSYPYMYDNINLNRTFFRFLARDKFFIDMATGSKIGLINDEIYPGDYELNYTFLSNENASYLGMAEVYRESLSLKENQHRGDIPLKLEVIAQDYKPGLFGKKYLAMTKYQDLERIVQDLLLNGVGDLEISYIGWNRGGYFDNSPVKPRVANNLGGRNNFKSLLNYLDENNIDIYFYDNPLILSKRVLGAKLLKKVNLEVSTYQYQSSLGLVGYHQHPSQLSKTILKNQKDYAKLGIDKFDSEYLGTAAYSYAYQGEIISRGEMIAEIKQEMEKLREYQFALTTPNDYLFAYLSSYYQAPYESSKYAFETDCVPFLSYVLSGSVKMFSPPMNFVSNYSLFALRLIEYNIYPSFIITKEPTYEFRHSNFEYIYTSEYQLWKEKIYSSYQMINSALKTVSGAKMINYQVLDTGIVRIIYDNNNEIYINYSKDPYQIGESTLNEQDFLIVGGDEA